jgi:trehalose/maltose transport system substrate-binding protein
MGGASLGISRNSNHPQEAMALVRFLGRRDVQLQRARVTAQAPTLPELYDDPELLKTSPYFSLVKQDFFNGAIARPSTVTGKEYEHVSEAYFRALHSVLTGEKNAAHAAADLEKELVRITGFEIKVPVLAVLPRSRRAVREAL